MNINRRFFFSFFSAPVVAGLAGHESAVRAAPKTVEEQIKDLDRLHGAQMTAAMSARNLTEETLLLTEALRRAEIARGRT